ncbi:serine protease inhibitor A6-like [Hyla sarda]|uniref:serine protease inhibitor A6-like n=1 Tax=Hyla sarda TaxID=327740 RepID=UPI0024C2CEBD|nr:serine protease inhibitor A6-like [Hyla sarda]
MWPPLLLVFSISMTIAGTEAKPKEDHPGGQWEGDDLSEASMSFAISVYKLVSSKTARSPPNVFISPISIYTTLAMLGLGARSSTRQQILGAMCLNDTQGSRILKEDYKSFLAKLRTENGDAEFTISNWFFPDDSIKVLPQYKQDVANYYKSSVQGIDFTDPQNAEQKINEQVSGRTDGKIEDLVSDLDGQTKMVLLDYASFNAKWQNPFTKGTRQELSKSHSVAVPMMHRVGQYRTYKDRGLVFVEVPYTDQLVLLIIMPNDGKLNEVEQNLSAQRVQCYLSKAKTSLLDLYIPQISLEQQINVQYALLTMGVIQVFSDTADLSRISPEPGLKVSRIYHKTLVKIAGNATESSGAEVIQTITLPKALELRIDRPFLALVYNKEVKTVLLIGRVMDLS